MTEQEEFHPEHYFDDEDYEDNYTIIPTKEYKKEILLCFHEDCMHHWIPSETEHYDIDCPDGSIRIDTIIGLKSNIGHPTKCPIDKHLNKLRRLHKSI